MSSEARLERALFAQHLCNLQPSLIRSRLLSDEAFCNRVDLNPRSVIITVGGIVRIGQRTLFTCVRRLLAAREEQSLSDVEGRSFRLAIEEQRVVLKDLPGREQPWVMEFPELMILSPRSEERLAALEHLLRTVGPAAPDFSSVRASATQRELSDEEATLLIAERLTGVAAFQARAERALAGPDVGISDLVPQTLSYYERLCGPDPRDEPPDDYLRSPLPGYRKALLDRDLIAGLDVCLYGTLRDDLSPGAWIVDRPDDVVWAALEQCKHAQNPFSLLGTLDIALLRQGDKRFRALAQTLTERLLSGSLLRPDGIDAYELLPLFADMVLNCLNTCEGGARRQPFWKRMAAWMHAGYLLRASYREPLDLASLREWVQTQHTTSGEYAKMLDLRREPMYSAAAMSGQALRKEVLGRLHNLRSRHEVRATDVETAILSSMHDESLGCWAFPGPLEGHRRPAAFEARAIPAAEAAEISDRLGADPAGPLFSALCHAAQAFDLSGPLLNHAKEVAGNVAFSGPIAESGALLGRLSDGCLVAAAQRDEELAKAIANAAMSAGPHARSPEEVRSIFRCLLLAGAAFEKEGEWAEWIEEQLVQLALRLPRGEPSSIFLAHLGELKCLVDLTFCIHGRAEALASAATGG